MDPTATPWRVLDDAADRTTVGTPAPSAALGHVSRSTLLMAAGVAVLIVVAFVLAFGAGANGTIVLDGGTPLGSATVVGTDTSESGTTSTGAELVIEIVGAIDRPGVYRLAAGARVGDLVEAAGGYSARVDTERASRELNLAAQLHDGDQIRVPSRDDQQLAGQEPVDGPGSGGIATGSGSSGSGHVDLNVATSAELEALPGIGPVTASKILTSRDEQRFGAIEDLRTRGLLGEKTYEKVRDLVTVR